jgi:hypothetical protein
MINDCFRYYKGCESRQKFRDVQLAPAAMLHPIIKPWSFCGWALDFIGQIHPASSKSHRFVLVAMDYFTKWMETIPYQVHEFAESLKIKLLSSSPYYDLSNG